MNASADLNARSCPLEHFPHALDLVEPDGLPRKFMPTQISGEQHIIINKEQSLDPSTRERHGNLAADRSQAHDCDPLRGELQMFRCLSDGTAGVQDVILRSRIIRAIQFENPDLRRVRADQHDDTFVVLARYTVLCGQHCNIEAGITNALKQRRDGLEMGSLVKGIATKHTPRLRQGAEREVWPRARWHIANGFH